VTRLDWGASFAALDSLVVVMLTWSLGGEPLYDGRDERRGPAEHDDPVGRFERSQSLATF